MVRLAVSLTILTILASSASARAQGSQLLEQGDQLRAAGRCDEAIDLWRAGLDQVPHGVFILRIGYCYADEGEHLLAVRYLRYALEILGPELPAPMREELEAALVSAALNLPGRVDVLTNLAGASLSVDGRSVGLSPLARALELPPGPHEIVATLGEEEAVQVRVAAAEHQVVELELEENTHHPQPAPRRRISRWWGLLLAGVGAGLAGAGGYLWWADGSYDSTRQYSMDTLPIGVTLSALGAALVAGGVVWLARPAAAPPPP